MRPKYILIALGAIVGLTLLGWGVRWVVAPINGQLTARERIQGATFRTEAYNHFYDLCASIQSKEGTIDAQLARTDGSPNIQQNVAALQARRLTDINQYNADAAKKYTEGQFRNANLPYHIAPNAYNGSNHTYCTQ